MKNTIQQLIKASLEALTTKGVLSIASQDVDNIIVNHSKDKTHGDYASNIAMVLCGKVQPKQTPKILAQQIIDNLPDSDIIIKAVIAGAGFINFFINSQNAHQVVRDILTKGKDYGHAQVGNNQSILIEFVSANPTGPLHVGHGRSAAYGSSVAALLRAVGYQVDCEYYVNDAGRQMDILTASVYIRYLAQTQKGIIFPDNGYKGDYIKDIARAIELQFPEIIQQPWSALTDGVGKDACNGGDKEAYIDGLIGNTKVLLLEDYHKIFNLSVQTILADIKQDLKDFRVHYDAWFSEQSLMNTNLVQKTLTQLKFKQMVYEKEGALWFKSTDFEDEKDRVVVRDNGQSTYFASDIAYHLEKLTRELPSNSKHIKTYDKIINIWGADHHGYIPRVRAGISALGLDETKLEVLLVQFANLYRGKIKVPMSTRSGSFVTLKSLCEEVGEDAARFFYILRKSEQHMDFDLELAKSKSNKNPVYYIQYAHARICRVLEQFEGELLSVEGGVVDLSLLVNPQELAVIKLLNQYSDTLLSAAKGREPHQVAYYLKSLATALHSYYGACEFLGEDETLTQARLSLISAVKQVIKNGLNLLGVNAPDAM